MTAFWPAAAALSAFALLFVLPPLLRRRSGVRRAAASTVSVYRDQLAELEADRAQGLLTAEQYEEARQEMERRVLEDFAAPAEQQALVPAASRAPLLAVALAISIPLASALGYLVLGNPLALEPEASAVSAQVTREDVERMVDRLASRLNESPNDARGWMLLGRSYLTLGRYAESSRAYERALELSPRDPDLLTSLAAALHMADPAASGKRIEELVGKALSLAPDHPAALALAGGAAFERGDFQAALRHWERLQQLLPAGSELSATIADRLNETRSRLAETPTAASPRSSR